MKRREFLSTLTGAMAWSCVACAQSGTKVTRIGWLTAQREASLAPFIAAFRSSLAELGRAEGKNLAIEFRFGDDSIDRVPALATELVQQGVELIVAQGLAVPLLSKLNLPIPIVYVYSGDPISAGLAESLAKPKNNMTGITFMAAELNGKRLELLREIIPGLTRVAIIANPQHPGEHLERDFFENTGKALGIATEYFATRNSDELNTAFKAIESNPPQAISLFADSFAIQNRQRIIDFSTSHRVPVISGWSVFAQSGAICTYGPLLTESYRRLAHHVDRVLAGVRPSDLAIEQPTRFQFVVNLKAAKILGITIPPSVLLRADEVIE
jgi:putative tryptophan/tyrosine transport system substrate-binding protein